MTLLEVVAGLALLASLLAALVVAKARYARQAAAADRRLDAVAGADALLAVWHQDPRSLPREGSGAVPGDARLSWRTRPVANGDVEDLGGRVVRLEIFDERAGGRPVLVGVEFVAGDPATAAAISATKPSRGAQSKGTAGKPRTDAKSVHHP